MISAKMDTLGLLKTKLFRNKGYDIIVASYNVTSAILSRDSNYIVDVARWPKFGKSFLGKSYHKLNL